jgi:hypothetical protein
MRPFVLAALLALAVPITAHAATSPAPDQGHAHVYLGHVDDTGRFDAPTFAGLPVIKSCNEATSDVRLAAPVSITAREGVRLRSAASPHADTVGRLASGARVRLLAVHNSFGYVWGEIDTGGAKVLATRTRSYAIDGFTGRSGTGPTPRGATRDVPSILQGERDGSAAIGVRLRC